MSKTALGNGYIQSKEGFHHSYVYDQIGNADMADHAISVCTAGTT